MAKGDRAIHEGHALNRDFAMMTLPLLLMALFYYGPRVLVLALVAFLTAKLADRLSSLLRGRKYDRTENSSVVFALIIVLMMPVTVRFRVIIVGVLVAVMVGKEAFGGFQSYPFNPACVGFCVASVSWPTETYAYPAPINWIGQLQQNFSWETISKLLSMQDVPLQSGVSATLKAGGLPKVDFWDLLLGNYAGPLGISCAVVIAACALYLFIKKRLPPMAPIAFLATTVIIAFVFPRFTDISFATFPQDIMQRLQVVKYELLGSSALFAAVFLVPEPGTLPKNKLSRFVYGILLGVSVMMFRYFGNYNFGTCFGFLLVNAISGYFDRAIARGSRRKETALQ